jgi:hypothetical protein
MSKPAVKRPLSLSCLPTIYQVAGSWIVSAIEIFQQTLFLPAVVD